MKFNKKGFTLIELIVVMAVIGVLVLLAAPKFMGYTKKAQLTRVQTNISALESASERYYMEEQAWPKLNDVALTKLELEEYAKEVHGLTGVEPNLDSDGKYYLINIEALEKYVTINKDKEQYLIQNPVGNVYYLKDLTETGKTVIDNMLDNKKPEPKKEPEVVIENEIIVKEDGTSLHFTNDFDTYVTFGDLGVDVKTANIRFYVNEEKNALTAPQMLLQYGDDAGQEVLGFGDLSGYITDETFSILSGISSVHYDRTAMNTNVSPGWHDIKLVWDESASKYEVFFDGVKQETQESFYEDGGHAELMRFDDFILGKGYYNKFEGRIDKIAIWSTSNYDFDFSDRISSDAEGLEGYWVFNSLQGDTIKDLSLNGRDGTVHNPNYISN